MLILSEYVCAITWPGITPVFHQLSKSLLVFRKQLGSHTLVSTEVIPIMPLLNCSVFPVIFPARGNYSWVILCRIKTVFTAGISSENAEGVGGTAL